ncbi:type VI secretion protein [Pseudomonas sp. CDFA 602]|nr:type VI secretion protein [Pseudomonas californiensis]MCD5994599.1 type VI secretion protein [Pseudomonas californiensis]MCD6000039.1 type VI secretion protein [Pseudomonas californiensis]
MTSRHRLARFLSLFMLMTVGGCTGHYTFSDDEYRPLGDPASVNRDK